MANTTEKETPMKFQGTVDFGTAGAHPYKTTSRFRYHVLAVKTVAKYHRATADRDEYYDDPAPKVHTRGKSDSLATARSLPTVSSLPVPYLILDTETGEVVR